MRRETWGQASSPAPPLGAMDPAVIAVSVGAVPWISWGEEIKVVCPEIRDHLTAMAIDTPELLVDCVNPEIAGPAGSQYMSTQDITWVDSMSKQSIAQADSGCGHRAKAKPFFHRAFACADEKNKAVVAILQHSFTCLNRKLLVAVYRWPCSG